MLMLHVDKEKPESVYRQLLDQITDLIEKGVLRPGYRMPSSRQLAGQTGLNRSTIVRVYEELWALGYVESTPGSYTRVRRRMPVVHPRAGGGQASGSGTTDAGDRGEPNVQGADAPARGGIQGAGTPVQGGILGAAGHAETIRMDLLEPDPRLIDRRMFKACAREAIGDPKAGFFGYTHPRGYPPLRDVLGQHMRLHGIHASDENILITNGSQNSLQLVFQSFATEKTTVAVESPTYSMVIPLLRTLGVKVAEIPMKRDGMDLNVLSRHMQTGKIGLVYSMPTFHNPTGVTMSQSGREELLRLCERHKALLVEDGIEEEMKFFGKTHLPVKSMDKKGVVIYLGSFSKVMAPGFRTSWVIADKKIIERLAEVKTAFDLGSNTASQAILHRFCASGGYELHIRRMMRAFRKRLQNALDCLKTCIPAEKASWEAPLGGFLIWVKVHGLKPGTDLERHFLQHGVAIRDGRSFYYSHRHSSHIRISISGCSEWEIEEGIKRIGRALSV